MPKPAARRATASPMRPGPTSASVAPWSSSPSQPRGSQVRHSPARTASWPATRLRAAARMSAKARSAVASVRTSGVVPTTMPRRAQAPRSTLSVPTA